MDFDDLDDAENEAAAEAQLEAEQLEQAAAEAAKAAEQEVARRSTEEPVRGPPEWKHVENEQFGFAECKDITSRNEPGDYYGIKFPHSKDQLVEWGPNWLTKAFHLSGVLPKDNAVTKIVDAKEFVGGGAGLKAILKVEYKTDAPYLHKELFVKLPHKGGSDRYYVSCMWNHDRPEMVFYIWLEKFVPFRVPKFYFGDISAKTTNYVLITEKIPYAEPGTRDFKPGQIEPPYDKHKDWELPPPGPAAYYKACVRALGKMAGLFKRGSLHPRVNVMFPMPPVYPEIPRGLPGLDADALKMSGAKCDQLIKFVGTTAKAVFWKEITDAAFLQQWKAELLHIMDYQVEMSMFQIMDPDYVALTHNNLQIDNAFFWRDENDDVQVGLLDWGVLCCSPLSGAIQGCISGAPYEVLVEELDNLLTMFIESYSVNGGPALSHASLKTMFMLQVAAWGTSIISNVSQVLKFTKDAEWKDIKDWMDPRLLDRFQPRVHCAQFRLVLRLWQTWDVYGQFKKWLGFMGLPEKR